MVREGYVGIVGIYFIELKIVLVYVFVDIVVVEVEYVFFGILRNKEMNGWRKVYFDSFFVWLYFVGVFVYGINYSVEMWFVYKLRFWFLCSSGCCGGFFLLFFWLVIVFLYEEFFLNFIIRYVFFE